MLNLSMLIRLVLLRGAGSGGPYEVIVNGPVNGYTGNPGLLLLYQSVCSSYVQ